MAPSTALARLRRAARRTEHRVRWNETLRRGLHGLLPTLIAVAAWVTYLKLSHDRHDGWRILLLALVAVGLGTTLALIGWAWWRPSAPLAGARRLDETHGLQDRISNALAFAELPPEARTPLMDAAITDGLTFAPQLSPARAAPLLIPRDVFAVVALAVATGGLATLQWSRQIVIPRAATLDAVALSPDDLEPFREAADALARQDPTPEVRAVLERFNQLVEDLAARRLERDEAMRRLAGLEDALRREQEDDRKALEDALQQLAEGLKKSSLSKPAAEALAKKDLEGAGKAMKELARKLRDPASKISADEKKRLQDALAAAAKRQKEAVAKLRERRDELRASLLQREQKATPPSEEERRLLQRDKRELDRLDRELAQKERAQRELERLDRELAEAAADLMRDLGVSANDLERGAEDLNRMGREALSEKEKEELRQALQDLREMLRQQGQGGEELRKRLRKFAKKARGAGSGQGGPRKPGATGEDSENEEEGDQKSGDKKGTGTSGEWVIGPGGKKIFVMKGGRSAGGQSTGQGDKGASNGSGSTPGGQGQSPGGNSWGTGHDEQVAGGAAKTETFGTQDVQAQAADTGQGPSVSETIAGASERGFVGKGYRKVYTDYRTKAEETMKNETIPPGYRFYVKRYFQLIRPREGE